MKTAKPISKTETITLLCLLKSLFVVTCKSQEICLFKSINYINIILNSCIYTQITESQK